MAKKIIMVLMVLVVIVLALVAVVASRPSHFHVERGTTIAASPAIVFAQVNDFHKWNDWSPWAKLDPDCKNTFSGADSGVGAVFAWTGNNKVGEGKMTILESKPGEMIRIKLEFMRPMAATNEAVFTFKANGANTDVLWSMDGECNFASKAFQMVMDMDKMVGGDFAKGLADIKTIAEAEQAKSAADATAAPVEAKTEDAATPAEPAMP